MWKDLTDPYMGHTLFQYSSPKPVQTSSDTTMSCIFTKAYYDSLIPFDSEHELKLKSNETPFAINHLREHNFNAALLWPDFFLAN